MKLSRSILPAFLLAVGCSSSSTPPASGDTTGSIDSGTSTIDSGAPRDSAGDVATDAGNAADGADSAAVTPPSTPAGEALAWVLAAINTGSATAADVTAHFSPAFLQQVPASDVLQVFAQLLPYAQWILTGFEGAVTPSALTAVVSQNEGEYWRVAIVMDASSPTLMDGLTLDIAPDLDPKLQTFADLDTAIVNVAPGVSALAASIDASGCTAIDAVDATQTRPLGSQFKLWILAALAQDVQAGTHAWTDLITIQDQYKSLPSGTYQNLANGTQLSAQSFAEQMISQSDNTAADHLLWFLGRAQVESMLTTTHHHDPASDAPFLTTREAFDIKLLLSPTDRMTYESDSTAAKRTLLAQYDTTLDPRTYTGSWVNPIDIDQVEWFATPMDLCNVMQSLKTFGDQAATAEVYHALSINPGVADEAGLFQYVGFKGGSEPGVLTMSWLVQRKSDGAWRYYGVEYENPTAPITQDMSVYLGAAGRALLAK